MYIVLKNQIINLVNKPFREAGMLVDNVRNREICPKSEYLAEKRSIKGKIKF